MGGLLQHTPGAHPRQSPYPTMKGFPLQPVGKGLGVCSKGVLNSFEPLIFFIFPYTYSKVDAATLKRWLSFRGHDKAWELLHLLSRWYNLPSISIYPLVN